MACSIDTDFPTHGLLPKKETGAINFLTKYPDFNGDGVTIAILDTGVDPAAKGLQETPNGETKVIDLYDASGSGDVDTSTVVEAKDGEITGLSGRKLKIPGDWNNPSGKYHIGIKSAYSLCPRPLKSRLKDERKKQLWTRPHNQLVSQAMKDKSESEKNKPAKPSETEKLAKSEVDTKVELLSSLADKYEDCGPVYDCVVFHNGNTWRACVDTSETGDLISCQLMASYHEEHQFTRFSSLDMLNFSVNIYQDGNILEICTNSGSHGTHVACISAAYHPDSPQRNGVAPGAKIVAIKISDIRTGGNEETSSAIVRAMLRVIQLKCDVVNVSFGETAKWNNDGRVAELVSQAVNNHGILFLSSAGNSGPALTTVGAPGCTISAGIGVGAYVSPDMMVAEYSMREKVPHNTYTWSSRGPANDGALGVTISAPGGAITSVPDWNLCGQEMMNGTSMSSPNATGCMALVLSGLKKRGIPYSTASTKRALINTAKNVESADIFSLGHGLFQVDKMFEHMSEHHSLPEDFVTFNVSVNGGRGIYLREPSDMLVGKLQTYTVVITPTFVTNNLEDAEELKQKKEKIAFQVSLALTCGDTWVSIPTHLEIMNTSRQFSVKLDVESLQPGAHFTEILAYDVSCIEKGPLFRVPITVIRPESESCVDHQHSWKASLNSGEMRRHFVTVPSGATCATVRIMTTKSSEPNAILCMHSVLLTPKGIFQDYEHETFALFSTGVEELYSFPVKENLTLEVCLAKYWSNLGHTDVEYSIQFHGVTVSGGPVVIHAGSSVTQLDISSLLRRQKIAPSVSFNQLVQTIRPSKATIEPLSTTRDTTPDGTNLFSCIMEYTFKMVKSGDVNPDFSLLSDILYENPLESQFWMLFDEHKQHLLSGDAYTQRYGYKCKLSAGEYTIRLHLRYTDTKLLEKLKKSPMLLRHSLSSAPLSLSVYSEQKEAILGGKSAGVISIPLKGIKSIFFTSIPDEKLKQFPVTVTAGCYLRGSLTLIKDNAAASIPAEYVLSDTCTLSGDSNKDKSANEDKDKMTEYKEAQLRLSSQWISKFKIAEALELYKKLVEDNGYTSLAPHLAILNSLAKEIESGLEKVKAGAEAPPTTADAAPTDAAPTGDQLQGHIHEFFKITNSIIHCDDNVNKAELLTFMGVKNDDSDNSAARKSEMNKRKKDLVEAYSVHLATMSLLIYTPNSLDLADLVSLPILQKDFKELLKFTDASDKSISKTYIKYLRANGCVAMAISQINKSLDGSKSKEIENLLVQLYGELGWTHVESHLKDWMLLKFPPSYTLF